jgi:predicted CoA-substrate-specific enzyme activase
MITAGIDIGHQTVKVAILEGSVITAHDTLVIAGPVEVVAREAYERVLEGAGLAPGTVHRLLATGVGRENVSFASGHCTEMLSHAKGAHWFFEAVKTVIDVGAEGTRIMRCDGEGDLVNFLINDKCASGTGVFLETVAQMMRIPIDEMGPLSLRYTREIGLTSTCAVFAESEIVAEIHRGSSREDILRGVHDSVASKIRSLGLRIGLEPQIVITGGVGRNIGVVEALKKQLKMDVLVPEAPEIAGAIGAAVIARDRGD